MVMCFHVEVNDVGCIDFLARDVRLDPVGLDQADIPGLAAAPGPRSRGDAGQWLTGLEVRAAVGALVFRSPL